MFTTFPAEFGELELLRRVYFTALGQIVLTFADGTD